MDTSLIAVLRRRGSGRIFAALGWILATGMWADAAYWKDDQTWSDGA